MRDSADVFQVVHTGMVNAGVDVDTVYRRLMASGHMPSLEGRFDHDVHVAFWRTVEEVTGDPDIGLRLCRHVPVYRGRVFEYIFLSAANWEQGFRAAFQYQRIVSDAFQANLVQDDDGVRIHMRGAAGDAPELRHTETLVVYSFWRAMRLVTDDQFTPTAIELRARPVIASAADYEALFGCPVTYTDGDNKLWLDPADLKRRSPHSDPELLKLHRKYGDNQLARIAREDLRQDIQDYLKRGIEEGRYNDRKGPPTLADVAAEFGVSARHLRFVLSEADTSFRTLLNDMRFTYASWLLQSTDEPYETVAQKIGFSEVSTFHRAFRKWSGLTPKQFRDQAGRADK